MSAFIYSYMNLLQTIIFLSQLTVSSENRILSRINGYIEPQKNMNLALSIKYESYIVVYMTHQQTFL